MSRLFQLFPWASVIKNTSIVTRADILQRQKESKRRKDIRTQFSYDTLSIIAMHSIAVQEASCECSHAHEHSLGNPQSI